MAELDPFIGRKRRKYHFRLYIFTIFPLRSLLLFLSLFVFILKVCSILVFTIISIMEISYVVWETAPSARSYEVLGQTHVNGWSRVIASQNGGSTSYIFPFRWRVLQWSRHLFNYWKNKKTMNEKFLILLIWNWIYIDHRKITWLWS